MLFRVEPLLNSNLETRIAPNTITDVAAAATMSDSDEGVTIHADSSTVAGGTNENKSPSTKGARRDEISD